MSTTSMLLQIGVKVIIQNRAGEILLLRRDEKFPLLSGTGETWDIPGGRIHADETLEDALAREVCEEVGIQIVGSPRLLTAQDIMVPAKDLHVVRLTYIHQQDIEIIKLSDEHDAHHWFTVEEAKKLQLEPLLAESVGHL